MTKEIYKMIFLRKFVFIYVLSAIIFSLLAFSCNNENDLPDTSQTFTGEEQEVTFLIDVPAVRNATPQLRSIGETEERTIQTIDLLAFRKNGSGSIYNYYYEGILVSGNGTNEQKCRIKVRLLDDEQEFMIITNAGELVKTVVAKYKDESNISKETFLAELEYKLPIGDKWKAISTSEYNALPMWGETKEIINTHTPPALSVSLLRMLAKIDVQLDGTKPLLKDTFKIKSVRLYNTNANGLIVPKSENFDSDFVTAPSLPNVPGKDLGPLVYTDFTSPGVADVAMEGAIYTFETEKAPEDKPLEATCLVIGGIYYKDQDTTYYRVDLRKEGKFMDILRNHRYLVNITSVAGSGYRTPDEAFRNHAVNMETEILDWKEGNIDNIIFDGQCYLSVNRDNIYISTEEQENMELTVKTDYSSGWEIIKIEDITDDPENPKPIEACGNWLDVKTKKGGGTEKLDTIQLGVTETNTDRVAQFLIVAGRLRYPVKIHQSTVEKASITISVDGKEVEDLEEIIYWAVLNVRTEGKSFTVSWTPKTADFAVYQTFVPGKPSTIFAAAPPIIGVTQGGNGGTGTFSSTIAPNDMMSVQEDRAAKLVFSVSNGINTVEKSLILRHVYDPNRGN